MVTMICLNIFFVIVVLTTSVDGRDGYNETQCQNPYHPYETMESYRDIQATYFNTLDINLCNFYQIYKNKQPSILLQYLSKYPALEESFVALEELGRTLIYATRDDPAPRWINQKFDEESLCWRGARELLPMITNCGIQFFLPDRNQFSYYPNQYHIIICPPYTTVRGRTANGILCSRYSPTFESNSNTTQKLAVLKRVSRSQKELTCDNVQNLEKGKKWGCQISRSEQAGICEGYYRIKEYTWDSTCVTSAESICGNGFDICGYVIPNFSGLKSPGPIEICCKKTVESLQPRSTGFRAAPGGQINLDRVEKFIENLNLCKN